MPKKPPKARILVVDDDEDVRGFVSATLTDAGYGVTEAPDGEEALAKLKRRPFDIVILDIMMPGLNGYEVLERIRAMPSRAGTPVIVLTAKGHEAAGLIREAAGGVDDHLAKPFQPESLRHAVEAVLAKSAEQRESERSAGSRAASMYESLEGLRSGFEKDPEQSRGRRFGRPRTRTRPRCTGRPSGTTPP